MPMFVEGQDPLQPAGGTPDIRQPLGQPAPDPFAGPSTQQIVGAALRQNNPIASVIDGIQHASPDTQYDPNHNPLDIIRGTKYEADNLSAFTSSPNEATTRTIMAKIDREDQDRQTLAASGWAGTVASVGAGLLDPTMYLPFVGEVEAARGGIGIVRSAARMATLGALQSTVSEAALQASQQTRTLGESAGNIASGTLLMGLLGAGAGALLSKTEHAAAVEGLDAVRKDFSPAVPSRTQMAQTGDALIDRVLDSPVTKSAIDNPVINREHDVPYGAGGSVPLSDPTVFIDRHFPTEMTVGGVTFDPAEPFAVHENVEQHVMGILTKGGMTDDEAYRVAHFQWAERAEGAWYRAHGIDQAAAEAQYKPILDQIQHEAPENPPPNLYTKPYPHDDVHLAQHEGTTEAPQFGFSKATRAEARELDRYIEEQAGDRETINGLIARNTLGEDTVVYRGHRHPEPWRSGEDDFVSTSTDRDVAADYAQHLSKILVDKDAPAIRTSDHSRTGMHDWEDEVILGKGRWEATGEPNTYRFSRDEPHSTETQPSDAETTRAREIITNWLKDNGGLGTPADQNAPQFGLAQAAGAAASDSRQLVLKGLHLPENVKSLPVIGKVLSKAGDIHNRLSPTLRVFSSDIVPAKRAMADLAETPLVFEDNARGIPTSLQGAPLDRLIKMQSRQAQMQASDTLHHSFLDYRYGKTQPRFGIAQSAFEDLRGQAGGKLSYGDFKAQVSEAMWNGDEHAIPQVQQAAQTLRQKVFRPVEEAAQRTLGPDGRPMLAEELAPPKGDKSFFPRAWNKEAIAAKRNQLQNTITEWLAGEQAQKAATKDRLTGLQADLEASRAKIDAHEKAGRAEEMAEETARHDGIRAKIEKEIADWQGKTTQEAKAALKARGAAEAARAAKIEEGTYQGAGARLTSADGAVDSAVKDIIASDRDLSRGELGDRANEIIDRLLGSPDGRLPYDVASGGPAMGPPGDRQQVRGSLNARDFAIPTSLVKDFVEKDTEHAVSTYLRTVLPDIMLTQRFGDVEMTEAFRKVNEAFAAKAAGLTSEKALTKLEAQRQGMIRDLAATRDRVRGVYGWSPDPRMRNAARIANTFRNWNLIADLGTSVFNRLQDATSGAFRYGFMNVMNDAYRPFLKGMLGMSELPKASRQQAIAMATAVDGMMGHMRNQFGDVLDNYRPGSKFERGLAWAADKSMLVNMHGPWTDWTKTMATAAASAEFLRAAERIAGDAGTAKDIERMAAASIDPHMATRIWQAYSDGGGAKIDGVHVPNTGDWKDASARQAFEAAMGREADILVITPGAEKPLWMSSPIASLLGQFKSFVAGAHERLLLANLQQRDAHTLQGLLTVMATGMLSYRLYTWLSGREASDRPQDWVKEAVSRSAITGWLSEINAMQAKFTSGQTDAYRLIGADHPLSRMQSASALSELLGPTYSHLEGLTQSVGDASRGTWNANDTHRIREWAWMQNLFAVRRLFDDAEDGINNAFGIKPRNREGGPPRLQ